MASLDDTLTRLAPKSVEGIAARWEMDHAPGWLEVTAWFSPGLKIGVPAYEAPVKHRVERAGDAEPDILACIDTIVRNVRARVAPVVVKRGPGRPRKVAA